MKNYKKFHKNHKKIEKLLLLSKYKKIIKTTVFHFINEMYNQYFYYFLQKNMKKPLKYEGKSRFFIFLIF
jgi:hypothetical protein